MSGPAEEHQAGVTPDRDRAGGVTDGGTRVTATSGDWSVELVMELGDREREILAAGGTLNLLTRDGAGAAR